MSSCNPPKIPQINFSGLEHVTGEWTAVQSQVMEALEEFGCFEVVCNDKLTPELREEFFGKAIKEPFVLPLEAKLRNCSDRTNQGYLLNVRGLDYESFHIPKCDDPESVDDFTKQMWGDEGNPSFREMLSKFLRVMKELDEMVVKMVFESYGVEMYLDSHLKTYEHFIRLSRYGAPKSQQVIDGLRMHRDMTLTTIVCQHELEGLEIQLKDGSWTTPSLKSVNFLVGDYFMPHHAECERSHLTLKRKKLGLEQREATPTVSSSQNGWQRSSVLYSLLISSQRRDSNTNSQGIGRRGSPIVVQALLPHGIR